jgi:hypothetical protein
MFEAGGVDSGDFNTSTIGLSAIDSVRNGSLTSSERSSVRRSSAATLSSDVPAFFRPNQFMGFRRDSFVLRTTGRSFQMRETNPIGPDACTKIPQQQMHALAAAAQTIDRM